MMWNDLAFGDDQADDDAAHQAHPCAEQVYGEGVWQDLRLLQEGCGHARQGQGGAYGNIDAPDEQHQQHPHGHGHGVGIVFEDGVDYVGGEEVGIAQLDHRA